MTEKHSHKKHARQPPSVPFLWEEKPGIPKKNWKPEVSSVVSSVPMPPVKLVASVPFKWEEKPGTPLPNFSQGPSDQLLPPPPSKESIPLPAPPMHYQNTYNKDEEDTVTEVGTYSDDNTLNDGAETDDSFSSAPSLLANCLIPSMAISSAVPAQKVSMTDIYDGLLEAPSSPASETDSSTSSYATGASSLVGSSFLQWLFPLFPPHSGFLEKVGHSENSPIPPDLKNKLFDNENNGSIVVRRPTTLGELIMMSRRRSYRRKAVQMRKQNLSMVNLHHLPLC